MLRSTINASVHSCMASDILAGEGKVHDTTRGHCLLYLCVCAHMLAAAGAGHVLVLVLVVPLTAATLQGACCWQGAGAWWVLSRCCFD